MDSLPNLEVVRAISATVRAKASDGDAMPLMEVRFSAFGEWYEINSLFEGHFFERVDRGAFSKTIDESGAHVKVLFNHGFDPTIGEKVLGQIESLTEEKDSPVGQVRLFDASYVRDLIPGLQAGVYGSSFRMKVTRDEWEQAPAPSDHNPRGLPERTIKEVRLFEFGPVTFPANPAATAGVRSMTDAYIEGLRSRDPQRVDELMRARDSLNRTSPAGTAGDAAETPQPAPAPSHPGGLSAGERRRRINHQPERK